jgi:hypothetical protein
MYIFRFFYPSIAVALMSGTVRMCTHWEMVGIIAR